jgi:hypothetical protein
MRTRCATRFNAKFANRRRLTEDQSLVVAWEEAERGPAPSDLDSAPMIDGWGFLADGNLLRAQGDLSGHPRIRDPWVTTSPVLCFNVAAAWMRTWSRWCRLGEPFRPSSPKSDAAAQRLLAAWRQAVRRLRMAAARGGERRPKRSFGSDSQALNRRAELPVR